MDTIEKISILFFSPNGATRQAAERLRADMRVDKPGVPVELHDLTGFNERWKRMHFFNNEYVIIALPVYYGRLPDIMREFFANKTADGADCRIVLFGGAARESTEPLLDEVKKRAAGCGFNVVQAEVRETTTLSVTHATPMPPTAPKQPPQTSPSCKHCGRCAADCPVFAINPSDVAEVDFYRCLRCMRCVNCCPVAGKNFLQ